MKDSLYFPHDSNASNDPKILALRGVYGSAGYGNYWMIIELLREQEGYRLKLRKYGIDALSIRLGYDRNTTEQFINDCCDTFELLQTDGEFLWCESLSKRMQPLEERREKARSSIMQRWKNKGDTRTNNERNTNVIRTNNERNTSKVKESKVNIQEDKSSCCDVPPLENPTTDNQDQKPERNQDPYWDSLVVVFGKPDTEGSKKLYGKVRRSIKATGCDPTEIIIRANRLRAAWGDSALTINSLETHWPKFAQEVKPLNGSRASPPNGLKFDRDAAIRDMALDIAQKEKGEQ